MLFLRKDLLRKVKQYDGKLANVIQTFQVRCPLLIGVTLPTHCLQAELIIDVRFAQLTEGFKVCARPISANDYPLTSSVGHS